MLSLEGYIDGITASIALILGLLIGIYIIHQSRKIKAQLLFILGVDIIFMGFMFLGVFLDFIAVLTTGFNVENIYGFIGLVSYIWAAPILFLAFYIGIEIKIQKKKKWNYHLGYIVIIIIFEIILFIDPYGSFIFIYPSTPGEMLINLNLNIISLAGIFFLVILIVVFIFFILTFYIEGNKTSREKRRIFFLILLGASIYVVFGLIESLINPGIFLIFVRVGYSSGPIFIYLGLRGLHLEDKKTQEVTNIFSRPRPFTEKEITFYREKKICLVCKGKAVGRTFIHQCDALYCLKCAEALIGLENICWVCENPLEDTKPIKIAHWIDDNDMQILPEDNENNQKMKK